MTFFESIFGALKAKKNSRIKRIWNFFCKRNKEKHSARNPKTGEMIYVPKKNKIRFRASKKLKDFINK